MMDYLAQVVVFIAVFATVGCGLNLVSGFGGMFSVAHAVYFGVGAYAYALLTTVAHWPLVAAIVVALALAGVFGAVVAFPALRLRGEYLIVASLAIQLVGYGIMQNWNAVTGGAEGVFAIPFFKFEKLGLPVNLTFAIVGVLLLAAAVGVMRLLTRSPWGRVLTAVKEDEIAAVSLGKHVTQTKVTAFGISAAMSAAGGVLFAGFVGYIDPESFHLNTSVSILAIVLIGGAGIVVGPVVGAVVITGLPELLRVLELPVNVAAQLELLLNGALLIGFMLVRPQGLMARNSTTKPDIGGVKPTGDTVPELYTHGAQEVLRATDVTKQIGARKILDGLSVAATPGKVVALIGPNGAGKTTFLDVVTGFTQIDAGEIRLGDRDLAGVGPERVARLGVVRVFQDQRLFPTLSVLENTMLGYVLPARERAFAAFDLRESTRAARGALVEHAKGLLDVVGLADKAHEPAGSLSGGQQRLIAIVRALCAQPRVLLLDEPCAGVAGPVVDVLVQVVRRLAREENRAVLVVEHNTEFVREVADEVAFLDRGRVLRVGTPEDVFSDHELSRVYFGVERDGTVS